MSLFWEGFGSVIDLTGSIADEFAPEPSRGDAVEIADDWRRVGDDLRRAAELYRASQPPVDE